ncbi:MAG: HAD family phosphatase [Actinomycetes bacterium]
MSPLAAVLFDMDGTTVETESLWQRAEVTTMDWFKTPWTAVDMAHCTGSSMATVAAYMAGKSGAAQQDISQVLADTIEHLMTTEALPVQPGVVRLHDELVTAGIPIALVSNSWRTLMNLVLDATGLRFDVTVASDEVSAVKPDPEPYLFACRALGVDPTASVVLEDSRTGVASAVAAGCGVVALLQNQQIEPAPRTLLVQDLSAVTLADLERFAATC